MSFDYMSNRWWANAKLLSQFPHRSSGSFGHFRSNEKHVFCGKFACNRLRSMLLHHQLIVSVRHPSEIANSVIGWLTIQVGNITKIVRIFEKGKRNQPMNRHALETFCSLQNHRSISTRAASKSFHFVRHFTPSAEIWISPFANLFAPRTDSPRGVRLIALEAWNWGPHAA